MKKIDIGSFKGGIVLGMFEREMKKVLENIADESTDARKERRITITIRIKPDKMRRGATIDVNANSTLAESKPAESILFFDTDRNGHLTAYEDDPGPLLPGLLEEETGKVVAFPRTGSGS